MKILRNIRVKSLTLFQAYGKLRFRVDPWCSGQTCGPVKAEIAGSNPVGSAKCNKTWRLRSRFLRLIYLAAQHFADERHGPIDLFLANDQGRGKADHVLVGFLGQDAALLQGNTEAASTACLAFQLYANQ